jgi:subtilase-type serine protease
LFLHPLTKLPMKKIVKFFVFGGSVFVLFTSSAFAQCLQTTTWRDATSSWFTAANWTNGVPDSTKNAQINNGGTAQVGNSLAVANACSLTLGNNAGESGNVLVSAAAGSASLHVGGVVVVASLGTATLTVSSGGSVTSGSVSVAPGWFPPTGIGHGTVTIDGTGSNWTANGSFNIGGDPTASHGGFGFLTLKNSGSVSATTVGVGPAGILGGTGTVNAGTTGANVGTTIAGTLAPDATLSLIGSLKLTSTATTSVDVTPSTSDKVSVQGTATLANRLVVTFSSGSFTVGARYTLLSATGGRTGVFSSVSFINTPSNQNICPVITYDANNVYLVLSSCTD